MNLLFVMISVVILCGTNSSIKNGLNSERAEQLSVLNIIGLVLNAITIIGSVVALFTTGIIGMVVNFIIGVLLPIICLKKHMDKISLVKENNFSILKKITFCTCCGMEVDEGVAFCTNCGNQINR